MAERAGTAVFYRGREMGYGAGQGNGSSEIEIRNFKFPAGSMTSQHGSDRRVPPPPSRVQSHKAAHTGQG
jgi:hypothetical protein